MKKNKAAMTYRKLISQQQKWIEHCEKGISYEGENGHAIRMADWNELKRLEAELAKAEGK